MDGQGSDEEVHRRRKGKRNPDKYKANLIKKARVQGDAYVGHRNNPVLSVVTGQDCNCKRRCFTDLSGEYKETLFKFFRSLETKNDQDRYLHGIMDAKQVKRRLNQRKVGREKEIVYHIRLQDGEKKRVCRVAFEHLHGITTARVRRLATLLKKGQIPHDKRGRTPSSRSRCLQSEHIELVKNHIESFPSKEIHYGNVFKRYLSAELDVKTMHNLFIKKYPHLRQIIKYSFYWKYFKENYTLSFGRPQVDVCSKCEELNNKIKSTFLNENAKRVAIAEKMVHIKRSKKFYSEMKRLANLCKEKDDVLVLCCDYMQNLPLPHIPVQEIFYYRQLWVNEFCVHNLKFDTATFYSYHEGEANKGPNEVCSFILQYIKENVPENVKTLYLFTDGCGGQNRNNTVVRFLMTLTSTGQFDKVYHYFPQRGHSFLPCDRDFGTVKRKIKKCDRVYSPSEYEKMIEASSVNSKFKVHKVKTEEILDFKNWWMTHYKKTCLSSTSLGRNVPRREKVSFQVSTYSEFIYCRSKPGYVESSECIGGLVKHSFYLAKGNSVPELPNEKAYIQGKVPINIKKIEDIKKVMQYVPEEHQEFWNNIVTWPTTTEELTEHFH